MNDSQFVISISRAIWGDHTLVNRAINEARIVIRYRDRSPRRNMTEKELNVIRGNFNILKIFEAHLNLQLADNIENN